MTTTQPRRKPDHVFVAPSPMRKALAVVAAVALLAAAYAGWQGWQQESTGWLGGAAAAAVVLVVCWVRLAVTAPQRVVVTGSVVEVRRASSSSSYDLEDPGVDLLVRDGSVAFGHYRDDWSIVEARDVDWAVFMDIVMRYQTQADINAEERDRRFSR